jgi:hypothetical protein
MCPISCSAVAYETSFLTSKMFWTSLSKPAHAPGTLDSDRLRGGRGRRDDLVFSQLSCVHRPLNSFCDIFWNRKSLGDQPFADGVATLLCAQPFWNIVGPKTVKCLLNSARLRASTLHLIRSHPQAPEWHAETGRCGPACRMPPIRVRSLPAGSQSEQVEL